MSVIQQKYVNECYFGKTVPEKITCIVSQWILHDIISNKISVDEMNILIKEHETLITAYILTRNKQQEHDNNFEILCAYTNLYTFHKKIEYIYFY